MDSKQFSDSERFHFLSEIYYALSFYNLKIRNVKNASYYIDLWYNHFKDSKEPKKPYGENAFQHFYNKYNGEINFLKGNFDVAEKYYKQSISHKIRGHNIANDSIRYLGKIAFAKKDFNKAISYLSLFETHNYDQSEIDEDFLKDSYKYLGLSYKALKKYEKANHYLEKYINSISRRNQYKDNVYAKLNKLEIKKTKQELLEIKSLEKQKTNYILYLIVILCISIVLFMIYLYKIKSKNKHKFNKLIIKLKELEKQTNNYQIPANKRLPSLKNSEVDRIISALVNFEEKELFLSVSCTLASTAKKLKTNTTYLSKIINTEYQKNFNTYITELRINYVIKRLKEDNTFRKYSILAIANEVGYKSKEGFNRAFKTATGILPSYFIKQLKNKT